MTIVTDQRMSLKEFLTYDDGSDTRYELVDGVLVEMGAESRSNLKIAVFLLECFLQLVDRQRIGIKEKIEVSSRFVTARDPDLIIHSIESMIAVDCKKEACLELCDPNPILVIEIVSPGNESSNNYKRDYEQKPKEYAARGIAEFWQVDVERSWVRVGSLMDGVYHMKTYRGETVVLSPSFSNLNLTAQQILEAG